MAPHGIGVWSPGQKQEFKLPEGERGELPIKDEPISPVWTPKSATSSPTVERKEFRPVKFESPVLSRKGYSKEEPFEDSKEPPWKVPERSSDTGVVLASTLQKRLPTSHSSPASGFNDLPTTRLPRAQNPTITLLQKAREGQLPKGAAYIEQEQSVKRAHNEKPPHVGPGEIRKYRFCDGGSTDGTAAVYKIKNEYTSESDSERPRKMADLGPRQFEGIGPTTRDGMPLILRSEVKDANQSKWYKKMYDTIHKQKPHRDDYVTVRYKQRRAQYPYTSGYLSEPEPGAYDSDFADYKYATLDRRRLPARDKENEYSVPSTMPRSAPERVGASVIKHGHDPYKNQPGRIENYIPGHSSISEKEAKEHLEQQKRVPQTKSFINQALKESGYESDSTLVFRRRDDTAQQLSPSEQKEAYKIIQKGGDIPLHGLRKPAPERPKGQSF
jgi:sorbin and SH3 domain-containing protein 1